MKKDIVCVAIMLCGLAGGSWATETNSSLAPLTSKTDRTIGVCHLVNSLGVAGRDVPLSPTYAISPVATASSYFNMFEKRNVGLDGKVTMLNGPEHGVLKEEGEISSGGLDYRYTPVTNYTGSDHATFLVEFGGMKVKLIYNFEVIDGGAIGGTEIMDKKNCPRGWVWKISTTPDTNGNTTSRGQV